MRIAKMVVAAGLLTIGLSLGACRNDRPGHWGDHNHHHHHRGGDHGTWR